MNSPAMARIAEGIVRSGGTSAFPKYRRIIEAIAGAIEHGTLAPGDRLPPETSLARLFSVSLGTVQKALGHLTDSGALRRTRRRGTFVTGRQADDVFVYRFRNPETGTVLMPFTRVLSVAEDRSDGPGVSTSTPSAASAWTGSSGCRTIRRRSARSTSRSSTAGISWTSRSRISTASPFIECSVSDSAFLHRGPAIASGAAPSVRPRAGT